MTMTGDTRVRTDGLAADSALDYAARGSDADPAEGRADD